MSTLINESLIESSARKRAFLLLDKASAYEILDPLYEFESPHLVKQNIVPQADDGMIIVKGHLNGRNTVIISIEGAFQGGGIGEVSGAKLAGTLEKIIEEWKQNRPVYPIIIYDTGGVRLQEANYGLLSIAEVCAAIVELKSYVPIIGIIPGKIGSFGGMSLSAGLCSALIMTREGRLGMNGPEVVEQEAGIRELNASNKALIWKMIGGQARHNTGLVDVLVEDDISQFKVGIERIWNGDVPLRKRTEQVDHYLNLYKSIDLTERLTVEQAHELLNIIPFNDFTIESEIIESRGHTWFKKLTNGMPSISEIPSVLVADTKINDKAVRYISVVPNPKNKYYRARNGEVGLLEGWAIAKYVREAIELDSNSNEKRLIVPIVDVPSQAFGYHEEMLGLYLACSAAIEAYATARQNGHPIVSLIVGNAISGAFLSHGLQGNRLIALNDLGVNVHVMSKKSAAIITQRTIEELDEAAKQVPSMAYDVQSFYQLGALTELIDVVNSNDPEEKDILKVQKYLLDQRENILADASRNLLYRLNTDIAVNIGRVASRKVRKEIDKQWI